MSTTNSAIQWAGSAVETGLTEREDIHHRVAQWASRLKLIKPLLKWLVLLAAVAWLAARDDVARERAPSPRDRVQVIHGGGRIATVDAEPTEPIEERLRPVRRNGVHATLPRRAVLLAPVSVLCVGGVAQARICPHMGHAATEPRSGSWHPCLAVGAPRLALKTARESLSSRRTRSTSGLATLATPRVEAVCAGSVIAERRTQLPLTAPVAPLLTKQNAFSVFGRAETKTASGRLHHTVCISCHHRSVA